MFVQTQKTPNPNSLKFLPGRKVSKDGPYEILNKDETDNYLIRNILVFETITITKSFGYNLWKGNNFKAEVEGKVYRNLNLIEQINKIPKDKYYDINHDKIFLNIY